MDSCGCAQYLRDVLKNERSKGNMNVIIGFENGQVITASGCAGFEVHAGGDICVLRKNAVFLHNYKNLKVY